jgi:mRNA interferase MazF
MLVIAELLRIDLGPKRENGLRARSQAMADKIVSVRRDRVGARIGSLGPSDLDRIDSAVRTWLSL